METLNESSWDRDLNKFSMSSVTVDGITYEKIHRTFDMLMFQFKDELDIDGDPADTGLYFRWDPKFNPSEEHWLSCGALTDTGRICRICGKVAF